MGIQTVRRVIVGFVLSGLAFVLSGCAEQVVMRETPVWDYRDEVEASLSRGDTRQKVRSVLGDPLVDARRYRVEVYRKAGRDIDAVWSFLIPIPTPGQRGVAIALAAYDKNDVVTEIAPRLWSGGGTWRVSAGGLHFVNSYGSEPVTLLGPSVSWKELTTMQVAEGRCSLVLVNGVCAMEHVSLDGEEIADLAPAGMNCSQKNYKQTFLRKDIPPGKHRLSVRQKSNPGHFETEFECRGGETVYAELEATLVSGWWVPRQEGTISIKKEPYQRLVDMGELHPILWHRGVWYGPPEASSASSQ